MSPFDDAWVWAEDFGFVKLREDAILPTQANAGDAGYDLYASEDAVVSAFPQTVVGTGVGVNLPTGYVGLICSRSGLAAKDGVAVLNAPGIIDSSYQGELKVILHSVGSYDKQIKKGDRIAQFVVTTFLSEPPRWTTYSRPSVRGAGGLGSTGA